MKVFRMYLPKRLSLQFFGVLAAVLLLTQCAYPNPTPDPSREQTDPPTSISGMSPSAGHTDVESANSSSAPEVPSSTLLTQRGIGELEVGPALSQTDVESYLGVSLTPKNQTEFCRLAIAEDVGVAIITNGETATWAFIVDNPAARTAKNIGVGSTYADILAAYGDAVSVLDRPSQTGGPIIAVDDLAHPSSEFTNDSRIMAFDTDSDGTVTRVRIGMYPWVTYTDYCSNDTVELTHKRTGWPLTRLVTP